MFLFIYFHICFSGFLRLILLQSVRKLEKDLAEKLSSKRCHSIPALKRGDHIDRYFPTAGKVLIGVDVRISYYGCIERFSRSIKNMKRWTVQTFQIHSLHICILMYSHCSFIADTQLVLYSYGRNEHYICLKNYSAYSVIQYLSVSMGNWIFWLYESAICMRSTSRHQIFTIF